MGPPRKPHAGPGPEPRPRTKVVVRNLPPGLSRSAFLDAIASAGFAGKDKVRWFDYVQGKAKPKLLVPSVAYVDLVDAQTVRAFADAFHGRAFAVDAPTSRGDPDDDGGNVAEASNAASNADETGESTAEASEPAVPPPPSEPESRTCEAARASREAAVEYAPNQRVPRSARQVDKMKKKRDPMEGTVERDAEYVKFLADLEAGPAPAPSAETLLDRREAAKKAAARANGGVEPARASALLEFLAKHSAAWRVERRRGKKGAKKTPSSSSRRETTKPHKPHKADTKHADARLPNANVRDAKKASERKASKPEKRAERKDKKGNGRDEKNNRRDAKARRAVAPRVLARPPPGESEGDPKRPASSVAEKKEKKEKKEKEKEKPALGRVVFLESKPASVSSGRASGEKKGKGPEPPRAKAREKPKPNGPGREGEKRPPATPRP